MQKITTLYNNIAKIFLNICIILLILEILSRMFVSNPYDEPRLRNCSIEEHDPYEGKQCYYSQEEIAKMQYDTFTGYIPAKNQKGIGWYTNQQHFRYDSDLSKKKESNEIRIFIIGGSTAWGAGVNQKQTFASVLENLLNNKNSKKKYRVIIGAAGGWTSSQEIIFVKNYISMFNPDIVIMFSGWNDIYNGYIGNDFNKTQDFLNYKDAILAYQDMLKIEGRLPIKEKDSIKNILPPEFHKNNSKLYYLVKKAIYNIFSNKDILQNKIKQNSLIPQQVNLNIIDNIDLMLFLSNKYKFNFLYCLQPSLYSTNKKLTHWEERLLNSLNNEYIGFSEYNKNLYSILRLSIAKYSNNKFSYLDCDNAISNEEKSVFVDHVHFGTRGNKLIAEFLFKNIKQKLLLDEK